MVQKSGDHQLSLVVYPIINPGFMDKNPEPVKVGGFFPIIYKVLYTPQVVVGQISQPSTGSL